MNRYTKTATEETYAGINRSENPNWIGWTIIDRMKHWHDYQDLLNNSYIPGLHDAVELHHFKNRH